MNESKKISEPANKAKEIEERIKSLQENKAKSLFEIKVQVEELKKTISAAAAAMAAATEKLDSDAYGKAKAEKIAAETKLEMYSDRLKQYETSEFVTVEESEKVLDSLVNYGKDLITAYENNIKDLLIELNSLTEGYNKAVEELTSVACRWTREIRPKYDQCNGNSKRRHPVDIRVELPGNPYRYDGPAPIVNNFLSREGIKEIITKAASHEQQSES